MLARRQADGLARRVEDFYSSQVLQIMGFRIVQKKIAIQHLM
jgi:hypothetical protein